MSKSEKNLVSSENSYSRALYELADENKSLSHIEEQASSIINLISKSEDFDQLIKDPTIKIEQQSKIINEISNKFNFSDLFKKFLNFLI